ncbi:hypothetical protein [Chamaesiphon sp.]|uniref:hypothetical protein n=1 Tax=Chamaesiphon sp. TaxID=2814140 RepID=UPI0035937DB5
MQVINERVQTAADIQIQVDLSHWQGQIDTLPNTIELRNEYGRMWRIDRGRGYADIIDDLDYEYHLYYLDNRLALVEYRGQITFNNMTPELELATIEGKHHQQWTMPEIQLQPSKPPAQLDRSNDDLYSILPSGKRGLTAANLQLLVARQRANEILA